MAVLKVKEPFPAMVRLSPPLSCRMRPVLPLARPVTVPPMVYGPPPPPPVLDFGKPLQAARTTATMVRQTKTKGFAADFMAIACSLLFHCADRLQTSSLHCGRFNLIRRYREIVFKNGLSAEFQPEC